MNKKIIKRLVMTMGFVLIFSSISGFFVNGQTTFVEINKNLEKSNIISCILSSEWKYGREISLDPATPEDNYQVKITLNTVLMGNPYENINPDGSDIRFFGSNGDSYDYWIESWNNTGDSIIWVEVPEEDTTIFYLIYGNQDADSESNGGETFIYYIRTENLSDWNTYGYYDFIDMEIILSDSDTYRLTTIFEDVGSGYSEFNYHAWSFVKIMDNYRADFSGFGQDYGGGLSHGRYEYGTDNEWIVPETGDPNGPPENILLKYHITHTNGGDWNYKVLRDDTGEIIAEYNHTGDPQGDLSVLEIETRYPVRIENYQGTYGSGLYIESDPPSTNSVKIIYYHLLIRLFSDNEPITTIGDEKLLIQDLSCEGSLEWTDIKPGSTVNGTFLVKNIGNPGSQLDWEIESCPGWGAWSFNPNGGIGLTGVEAVNVEVVAPDDPETEFTGEVKIVNSDDPNDYCTIPVYLKTPKNKGINTPILNFLQNHPNMFPILRQLLGL